MTDKDPKDMTASELVRWVENYTDIMCRACREMGFGCDAAEVGDCEKALDFIADKIDAELAQARKEAVNESKKPMWWFRSAIKRGEDWPEPRDGETEYWRCVGFFCGDCPAEIDGKRPSDRYGVLNCSIAQGMDIARRQADLDARKGGE